MPLQTNVEELPKGLEFRETLEIAENIAKLLESAGFKDDRNDNPKISGNLVRSIADLLKSEPQPVRIYLRNLSKVPVKSRGTLLRAAIRIAGLREYFRRGITSPTQGIYAKDHWVASLILDLGDYYSEELKRHRFAIKLLVLNGPVAGLVVVDEFSRGFAAVMRDEIGARLRRREAALDDATVLTNMRYCYVAVFLRQKKRISVGKVAATPSMKSYNKRLVRSRFRELSDCPFGASFNCMQCSATTLQCPRAVRMD